MLWNRWWNAMDEFAKTMYEQWRFEDDNEIDWGDYTKKIEKINHFLNGEIAEEIKSDISKQVWKIEENAFIAGFCFGSEKLKREFFDKETKINDYLDKFHFLIAALFCVRISIKGNEDVIPTSETVSEALLSIGESLDEICNNLYEIL